MASAWLWMGLGAWPAPASASDDACDFYKRFLPAVYDLRCTGKSHDAGEAYSSFADAFNINPATVPASPSPYGLETIASYPSLGNVFPVVPTFALIKGFHKIGTAVSTGGNDTFYGDDVYQRTYGTTTDVDLHNPEPAKGYLCNLNVGSSVSLPDAGAVSPSLGFSLRYNHITNTLGWGSGLALAAGRFSAGIGMSREAVSNFLPTLNFYSGVLAYHFPKVDLEYTVLLDSSGSLGPIHILTASLPIKRFLISAAVRELDYLELGSLLQVHGAIQVQLSPHLTLGYLVNYIPGTQSAAMQVFL